MKKTILLAAVAAVLVGCSEIAINDDKTISVTTTFEDKAPLNYWGKLIDTQEYSGPLIYSNEKYLWAGGGFAHELVKANWGSDEQPFWGWDSGAAISNYVCNERCGYGKQLSVRGEEGKGGHNGSANFAVWTGHDWGGGIQAVFTAVGSIELVEMYVNNTAYALSYCYDENGACKINEGQQAKVVLTATKEDGSVAFSEFMLVDGTDHIVSEWTRWDLSGLGKIKDFTFNVTGNINGANGFEFPAYFAFDDVVVKTSLFNE